MAIVLVIIGLIVGGVLVGQSLINAAALRAQISQIEKYNTAANTFQGKYGGLPGDLSANSAAQFGFVTRTGLPGQGDGNGLVEGFNSGLDETAGETLGFWVDLSTAGLIDGNFANSPFTNHSDATGAALDAYFPQTKLGQGNYIYVYSGGSHNCCNATYLKTGINNFGLSVVTHLVTASNTMSSQPGLTVEQAFAIDSKIDDGYPMSGRVTAVYVSGFDAFYANGGWDPGPPDTSQTPPSSSTCYDNGNNAANPMQYSLGQNGGAGVNCALSFQFR